METKTMQVSKNTVAYVTLSLALISTLSVTPDLAAAPFANRLTKIAAPSQGQATLPGSTTVFAPEEAPEREPEAPLELPAVFVRGDADGNGNLDMTDSVYTLSSLFLGTKELRCQDAADANDSGEVELTDTILVLSYLFAGNAVIPAPFPGCGLDTTADRLSCDALEACPSKPEAALAPVAVDNGHVVELPLEILEAIPEGAKVRLRRVEGGTTRVLEGVASRFSEGTLLIESSQPSATSASNSTTSNSTASNSTAIARVGLGGTILGGGGLVMAPTTPAYDCNSLACVCDGDDDCNDLFGSGLCGDGICWEDESGGVVCMCVR